MRKVGLLLAVIGGGLPASGAHYNSSLSHGVRPAQERQAGSLAPERGSTRRYVMVVDLSLQFRSPRYNTPGYLRSLWPLQLQNAWAIRRVSLTDAPGRLTAQLVVDAGKEARSATWLRLMLGSHRDSIRLSQRWDAQTDPSSTPWWLAREKALLSVPDPTWPAMIDARLIAAANGLEDLLRVTVHNASNAPVDFNSITLSATWRRSTAVVCSGPDEVQRVKFDWTRMVEAERRASGWTTVGSDTIAFPVRISLAGRCSDRQFSAEIPIAFTLAPGEIGRITLRIPRTSDSRYAVLTWPEVVVELQPVQAFPSALYVTR